MTMRKGVLFCGLILLNSAAASNISADDRVRIEAKAKKEWRDGNLPQAIQTIERLVELEIAEFGPQSERLAFRLASLADMKLEMGDATDAQKLSDQAAELLAQNHPPGSWQHVEAERFKQNCKRIVELSEDKRQESFGFTRELTQAMQDTRFDDALAAAEQLAKFQAETFGERHPSTLASLAAIENIHLYQGKIKNSVFQLDSLIGTLEQINPMDHPATATAYYLLACVYQTRRDSSKSIQYGKIAVDRFENGLATYYPEYASALSQYATVLFAEGDYELAIPALRKAYDVSKQVIGVDQSQAPIATNLYYAIEQRGKAEFREWDLDEAEKLYGEAQQLAVENWSGDDYRIVDAGHLLELTQKAKSWNNEDRSKYDKLQELLSEIEQAVNRNETERAFDLADQRFVIAKELFGMQSAITLQTERFGFTMRNRHATFDSQETVDFVEKWKAFNRRFAEYFGSNHPDFADSCYGLARRLGSGDKDSVALARISIAAYQASTGAESDEVLSAETLLGKLLAEQQEEDCERVLASAAARWQSRPSRGCYRHYEAVLSLADYYLAIDDPYSANQSLESAINICRNLNPCPQAELASALNKSANLLYRIEAYNEALIRYREAQKILGLTPLLNMAETNVWILCNIADCHLRMEEPTAAEHHLRILLKLFEKPDMNHPALRNAYYSLVKALQKQSREADANATMTLASHAVKSNFGIETIQHAELLVEQGELLSMQENRADATVTFERALQTLQLLYEIQGESKLGDPLIVLIDRVIVGLENAGTWGMALKARTLVEKVAEKSLEGWPHIAAYERRQLVEAKSVAEADPESKAAVNKVKSRTFTLRQTATNGFKDSGDPDPLMHEHVDKVIALLGPNCMILADYYDIAADCWIAKERTDLSIYAQLSSVQAFIATLGEHPRTARSAIKVAAHARELGFFQISQSMIQMSINIFEKFDGEKSHTMALARLELAQLYLDIQDFGAALPIAQSATEILAIIYGKNSEKHAIALQILSSIYEGLNEFDAALQFGSQANTIFHSYSAEFDRRRDKSDAYVAILTAKSGKAHRERMRQILSSIGHSEFDYPSMENIEKPPFRESLEFIPFLIEYAGILNSWKEPEYALSELDKALALVERNGAMQKSGLRLDLWRSQIASRRGEAYRQLGKLAESRQYLQMATDIRKRLLSEDSYLRVTVPGMTQTSFLDNDSGLMNQSHYQLALVDHLLGNHEQALESIEQGLAIQQRTLVQHGQLISDPAMQRLLGGEIDPLDLMLSIRVSLPNNATVARGAFEWVIQQKGIALDMTCRMQALQQSRVYDSATIALATQVRMLNEELATVALTISTGESDDQKSERRVSILKQINDSKIKLASALQRSQVDWNLSEIALPELQSRLADDTVVIDYVLFNHFSFQEGTMIKQPHYMAFLLLGKDATECQMKDLGPAEPIDQMIQQLRKHIQQVPEQLKIADESQIELTYKEIAGPLYQKLCGHWDAEIADAKTLLISPDAAVNGLPFNALVGSSGRYLIEDCEVAYLTSIRDLNRKQADWGEGTLIIAGPNFDADSSQIADDRKALAKRDDIRSLVSIRGAEEIALRSSRWQRLRGAEDEAKDLESLLNNSAFTPVKMFTKNEASEEILKGARSPRILHLATHGFYLQPPALSHEPSKASTARSGLALLRSSTDPLLRSGIVLAGANRVDFTRQQTANAEDGWVTAQEISAMNFRNTQLVVLSACESGLGDVTNGQGVQGLRRAFTTAGAQSLLTSLFKVPDRETRDLMRSFYENFVVTADPIESLGNAQRTMVASRKRQEGAAHPYFWASFVLLGHPTLTVNP